MTEEQHYTYLSRFLKYFVLAVILILHSLCLNQTIQLQLVALIIFCQTANYNLIGNILNINVLNYIALV
jgi:hypothetical protein